MLRKLVGKFSRSIGKDRTQVPSTVVASLIPHRYDMLEKTRQMRHMDSQIETLIDI